MSRIVSYCLLACIALSNTPAHADFVVKTSQANGIGNAQPSPRSPRPANGVVADDPHIDPADTAPPTPAKPVAIRPRPVAGFGDQVPLSFACRQIVPRGIKVSFGRGVNPATPVSWKGGDTWPLVLGRAIKPAGLHMVELGTSLQIKE